jgi:DNA-binding transcriptional regulator YiaG
MARRPVSKMSQTFSAPHTLSREELEQWLRAGPSLTTEEIRGLREQLGFTQRDLARLLGLSESSVSLWEAGKRTPRGPAQRLLKLIAELSKQR